MKDKPLFNLSKNISLNPIPANWNGVGSGASGQQQTAESSAFTKIKDRLIRHKKSAFSGGIQAVYAELLAGTLTFERSAGHLLSNASGKAYCLDDLERLQTIRPQATEPPLLGEAIRSAFIYRGEEKPSALQLQDFNQLVKQALDIRMDHQLVKNLNIDYTGVSEELQKHVSSVANDTPSGTEDGSDIITALRESLKDFYRKHLDADVIAANPNIEMEIDTMIRSHKSDIEILTSIGSVTGLDELLYDVPGHIDYMKRRQTQKDQLAARTNYIGQQQVDNVVSYIVKRRFEKIPNIFHERGRNVLRSDQSDVPEKRLVEMVNHLGLLPFRSGVELGSRIMAQILQREIIIDSDDLVKIDRKRMGDGSMYEQERSRLFAVYPDKIWTEKKRNKTVPPESLPFIGIRINASEAGTLKCYGIPIPEGVRAHILLQLNAMRPGSNDPKQYHFSRNAWAMAQVKFKVKKRGLLGYWSRKAQAALTDAGVPE